MTTATETRTATVRQGTDADLERLVEMGRAFLRATAYQHRIAEDVSHVRAVAALILDRGRMFVAVDETDHIIGMLGVIVMPHVLLNDLVASEVIWWVDAEARQSGAGGALFAMAEAWARTEGAVRMQFTAYRDPVLERLYRRLGYHAQEVIFEKELV